MKILPTYFALTLIGQADRANVRANHLRQPSIPNDIDDCIPSPDLREAIAAGATDPDSICQNSAGGWFGFTHAYQCDDERGPGYACCDETDATLNPGHILGTCTKMTTLTTTEVKVQDYYANMVGDSEGAGEDADADADEAEDGPFGDATKCTASWELKNAVAAGATSPDTICGNKKRGRWLGYVYAFKCDATSGPGYACCSEDTATLSPGNILGTCTRITSDDEEEDGGVETSDTRDIGVSSDSSEEEADEAEDEEKLFECTPSWELKKAVLSGNKDPDGICEKKKRGQWFNYVYAYKCTAKSGPGYACCNDNEKSLKPGGILGTCYRIYSGGKDERGGQRQ